MPVPSKPGASQKSVKAVQCNQQYRKWRKG